MHVWTVGHSSQPLDDFMALLGANGIELVADVRTFPASRRHPHFHGGELARTLPEHGVAYRHLPRLGGRRRPGADSPNGAWRHRSFRAYADHALTDEFAAGLAELRAAAAGARTAMMCSEALWWRCHRRLVADRLVAAGDTVLHIGSDGRTAPHELPPFAAVQPDGRILYPATPPADARSGRAGPGPAPA